ncbi:MAG: hypothetical protein FD162_2717 [Rhodobacteraceae bacterium]|uniref:DUF2339 domain-containing protein n=1 Tax=Cypionkella sp. TaxID=2811411 RepID=UPI0013295A69|nr:DUF2339 domain-containing protein [Cypionkella sp.]KAF0171909.1 MAG: hypothetical protein FD162_2717 [Paracoccaceae bacterium]MDO8328350.1 DUF2339 domain-containing protein [Cypionkella sp.]
MDGIVVLLMLAALAIPVAVVALVIGQGRLRRRVMQLEDQLSGQRALLDRLMRAGVVLPQAAEPAPVSMPAALPAVAPEAKLAAEVSPHIPTEQAAEDAPRAAAVEAVSPATPWDRARAQPVERVSAQAAPPAPPSGPDPLTRLAGWLRLNWVYAVSAASLALAGIFLVQYGIENGLLPPWLRVMAAIGFGGCLIAGGEWLRRLHGDSEAVSTAYLPSVFAGAGLVSIFAAVLSARLMYGLIGPQTAFAGHVLTATLAIGLGWFYGPLLAAVGLLGAAVAPFIVDAGTEAAAWLYGYYAVVAIVGLAVDTLRRWAWLSVLGLVLGYGGGLLSLWAGAGETGWIALLVALPLLAVMIPDRALIPRQDGPCLLVAGWTRAAVSFPVMLAAVTLLVSSAGLAMQAGAAPAVAVLAFGALVALALAYLLWADRAAGLADLGFIPAVGLWLVLTMQGLGAMPLVREFAAGALRGPEVAAPRTVTLLLGLMALVSLAFALRSFRRGALAVAYALAAVLVAPVAAVILELFWQPGLVIGPYPWALHVIALACAMVALALRYGTLDLDKRRVAYATLSALSLIGLALFLITTKTALTLALAVLAVVAAALDRRFKLPEMGWFIQLAVAVLVYRLLVDPGLDWALQADLGSVVLVFTGVIAALLAALWLVQPLDRLLPKGVLESAAAGLAAVFANVLISRWLLPDMPASPDDYYDYGGFFYSHWGYALNAIPWLALMLMQIYRARLGGALRRLRQAIALLAGVFAGFWLGNAVTWQNPLFAYSPVDISGLGRGPMLLDTLLLAYGVPGLILLAAAWKLPGLSRRLRIGFTAVGAALLALYTGLEIRRFWQGDWLGKPGVEQGELYSYTLALMLLGAALLYQAIARRSGQLRRLAMIVIGLTIAKVFLLDAAGLTGLTRVFSFLGLGLSLAGLAWLNRWAGQVSAQDRNP